MRRLYVLIIATLVILICMGFNSSRAVVWDNNDEINAYCSENLLRLHVLANSSSPEDQYLKRQVRYLILKETNGLFKEVSGLDQALDVTNTNLLNFQRKVEEYLLSEGKRIPVKMEIGSFEFPTRTYGNVTLPTGEYRALRIILGEGEGNNWWCVLFPPLCLDQDEKFTEEQENQLASLAFQKKQGDLKVEYRFKILEGLSKIPKWVKANYLDILKIGLFKHNGLLN
ncbi:MAG: stage II sporulation protein R [Halanaerobiales bacterium]|nr:stage II sporulation protein R [Halanaerobiales bacterium]